MYKSFLFIMGLLFCLSTKAQRATTADGYYYTISGQKIPGIITFQLFGKWIIFKTDVDAKSQKISINDIKAFVITDSNNESDSLIVSTDADKENEKYFAELFLATPTVRFYHRFVELIGAGPPP